MTDTYQASARHTAAGMGEAYWFFDSLMVIRADQPGQPVIGPPMSDEEAAVVAAGSSA